MQFSQVLASVQGGDGQFRAEAPESWAQGRTLFGGLQAALAVRALRLALPQAAPLRTVQVVFVAPVPPGIVQMQTRLLRAGKSATQMEARILDGSGQLACLVIAIFGAARSSVVRVSPAPPRVPPPDGVRPMPYIDGLMPAFLQHCEMRWAFGSPPFSGSRETRAQIYARLPGETTADECTVLALADFPPPLGLSFLKTPAPGSSMTWALDFIGQDFSGEGSWLLDGELTSAADGYLSQGFTVWSPQMKPVALSRQAMVVFA